MKKLLAWLALALVSTSVMAGSKPFNMSITPEVAIFKRSTTIKGLTLSLWGENQQTSLALGIVNGSSGDSGGLSWALFLNYADNYRGIQWAAINYTEGDFFGWQDGFLNYSGGDMKGLQMGLVNYAGKLTGLQFGFVNYAKDADTGVQLGIVNIIRHNKNWFTELPQELAPAMFFFNWRF